MDRINLKKIALSSLALVTVILISACPLADPLELRSVVEERVAAAGIQGVAQIVVTQEATGIANEAAFDVGPAVALTTKDTVFTVSNPGTAPLYLTGVPIVAITGANQAEFSIESTPASPLPAKGTSTFALRFSPSAEGVKTATITITNSTATASFSFSVTATASPQDLLSPTGSVSLAGGSAYTNVLTIPLTIAASDVGGGTVSQMLLGNEATFSGMVWEPYAVSRVWTIPSGDNAKTVYIRFKDNSGNISSIYSDSILLDTVAPTIVSRPIVHNSSNAIRSTTTLSYAFSEAMNPATLTGATVKLVPGYGAGAVTTAIGKPDATHVTLSLGSPGFYYGRSYTLNLLAGITDLAGNALPADTIAFTVENDIFENTGAAGEPTGNGYPNNPFFLWSSDPAMGVYRASSGQLNSQEYDGYLARSQSIGGFSDQDRYRLYIDCAQSDSITIHVFTTDSFGTPTGALAAGQGIKFTLYSPLSSPVLISSGDINLLKNDQTGTWMIPYGTEPDYYTLVVYGDDSGRYYDVTWSEAYNGM